MYEREKKNVISDDDLIKQVQAYLATDPGASRGLLRSKFNTSEQRLERLSEAGHFVLQKKMSRSIAATMNRKKHKIMDGWTIASRA
jgi:hypothetical protein